MWQNLSMEPSFFRETCTAGSGVSVPFFEAEIESFCRSFPFPIFQEEGTKSSFKKNRGDEG